MRWRALFFIVFSISSTTHGQTSPGACLNIFPTDFTVVDDGLEIVNYSPSHFLYKDKTYGFLFEATLQNGVLSMNVQLTNKGFQSSHSYEKFYNIMMTVLGIKNVQVISEIWQDDINHMQFYKNRQLGFAEADAALLTDAGQQAARFGFSDVNTVFYTKSATPGGVPSVNVKFVKPLRLQ